MKVMLMLGARLGSNGLPLFLLAEARHVKAIGPGGAGRQSERTLW